MQKHYLTEKSWLAGHRLVLLGHIPSHHERRWAKPPHQSSEGRYMCSDAITSHGPACVGSAVVTRLPRTSVVSGSNPDASKDMLYWWALTRAKRASAASLWCGSIGGINSGCVGCSNETGVYIKQTNPANYSRVNMWLTQKSIHAGTARAIFDDIIIWPITLCPKTDGT